MATAQNENKDDAMVQKLLSKTPKTTSLTIHHEIKSLEGHSAWHIGDSHWWVRLHDVTGKDRLTELDKARKYRVTGIVLEQNYGVVEVWVKKVDYAD